MPQCPKGISESVIRVQDMEQPLLCNKLVFINHLRYAMQVLRITQLEDL